MSAHEPILTLRPGRSIPRASVLPLAALLLSAATLVAHHPPARGLQALQPPGPPSNLRALPVTCPVVVTLFWNAPTTGGPPATYIIEAGLQPGRVDYAISTNSAATTYTVTEVPAGLYYLRVRARNAAGTSDPSNEIALVVGPCGCLPPASPATASATTIGQVITLVWSASPLAQSYVIEAGTAPGGRDIAVFDTGTTATSFSAAAPPGTYYIRIRARNACGTSPPSPEVVVTVGAPSPGCPSPGPLTGIWTVRSTAPAIVNCNGELCTPGLERECECRSLVSNDPIVELFSAFVCQQGDRLTVDALVGLTQVTLEGIALASGASGPIDDRVAFTFRTTAQIPAAPGCQTRQVFVLTSPAGRVIAPDVVEGDWSLEQTTTAQCALLACPSVRAGCTARGRYRAVITQRP